MRAVFLTYNSIGRIGQYANGVVINGDHRAILFQHSQGKIDDGELEYLEDVLEGLTGGDPRLPDTMRSRQVLVANRSGMSYQETKDQANAKLREREVEVTDLYCQVERHLTDVDLVVIYIGLSGSEAALRLTKLCQRVTPVMCSCNFDRKLTILRRQLGIAEQGLRQLSHITCECEGRQTMEKLLLQFLATGTID